MGLLDTGWQVVWLRIEQSVMQYGEGEIDMVNKYAGWVRFFDDIPLTYSHPLIRLSDVS